MSEPLRTIDGLHDSNVLAGIQAALSDFKYGAVEITVHNGQVVQIERKEKFRLQPTTARRD